jgi:hypothetical protein
MMCTAPGVTRMVRVAKTRLLFGMVGALLLGCSASGGSTGQGTGGTSNAGGNAATGGVTSAGGSSAAGGSMSTGGSAGTGGSVAEAGGSTGQGTGGTSNAATGGADQQGRKQCRGRKHEHGRLCGDWRLGRGRWLACQWREHGRGRGWHSRKRRHGDRWSAEHRRRNRYRRFACNRWGLCNWGNHQHWRYKGRGWNRFNRRGDHWRRKRRSGWYRRNLTGSGGTTTAGSGPCDIYAAGNTPCVAAHSTVRVLLGAYKGNLYQVRRASDNTTKDIGILTSGGFADSAVQDTFCSGTTCTISIIYDQSGKGNHLTKAPAGQRKTHQITKQTRPLSS